MLRSGLLFLSRQRWLRSWVENSALSRKMTARFVAGRTLEEELAVVRRLESQKIFSSLDHLGENVSTPAEAAESLRSYCDALDAIERGRMPATISIKLTQLGLDLSAAECARHVYELAARAARLGTRVEIDMESHDYVDRTLAIVRQAHERTASVRAVIQAYLYRSEKDVEMLCAERIPVRLCKGAYREPAAVAFPRKRDVDASYVKLMKKLLADGVSPAIASHDEAILAETVRFLGERRIAEEAFEFQMLYGVRRDLQRKLVGEGYRLRLYVPYGDAWYPYFMRRLAERPANLLFLARSMLRR